MKCLDTNILIDILRNKHDAGQIVRQLDIESRNATTTVSALELFYGANHSKNKANNVENVRSLLQKLEVLPLTLGASELAGELMADLAQKGEIIEYRDAMIAGIVLELGITLVTRNKKHFVRIPRIKLE
jgi:tRNA(fMet)-specific endonuclease VapC